MKTEKMTDTEKQFMTRVTKLAIELNLAPRETIPLFGMLTRLLVQSEMHQHHADKGTATKQALDLFLAGFGGRLVPLPDAPPDDKGLH